MGCGSSSDSASASKPHAKHKALPKENKIDWEALAAKLPPLDNSRASKEKRKEIFGRFDVNGNGFLSLAELDKGIDDVLKCQEIFKAKPVIMRAFQSAKAKMKDHGGHESEEYIELSEFRVCFVYLRKYYELYQMFEQIDGSVDSLDDRRISSEEFKKCVSSLNSWGAKITDASKTFSEIDVNGGGIVLFDEFAAWALKHHLELVTGDHFTDNELE